MQLLMSPASPFVRKVRVLLRETGQIDQVEEVSVTTAPASPDAQVAASSSAAKIPVLLREDGPAIHDSRVICRYLDQLGHGHGFYPNGRLWEVLTLESSADAISDAAVLMTYEVRCRAEAFQSQDWMDTQWAKIDHALTTLEASWMPLLSGPLHMGQIATACALGYLDLRHEERKWRDAHPALAAWADRFAERPSMQDTAP